jgi:DNA-binding response OmpR family regulator
MPEILKILLIEDDLDDIEFLKVALADNSVAFTMETLMRGDLIISWLEDTRTLPDLIIMDLNLPKLHGKEVLCKIKEKERFKHIPLMVLTTSSSLEDKEYCLKNGADRFMTKPSDTPGFKELAESIAELAVKK